ncbi:MAG TPA: biopolymer transporter ExbD, partial [Polyangiaceae bacterium]|nr:biopolymer transporter ExbD [Polyangiaceae bacterium]
SLEASGALWLDGKRVSRPELRRALRSAAVGRERRAIIAADGATAHRQVISVIDLLRQEGITQFAINVQPSELGNDG